MLESKQFFKKFSDKHLRVGARTWRPRDRDEIYRQRYLASLGPEERCEEAKSTEPLPNKNEPVNQQISSILTPTLPCDPPHDDHPIHDLTNHQPIHDYPTQTPGRDPSLHRISTSHSHRSHPHQPIPSSSALNQSPENLTNHQSIHDYPTQTPGRDPSLHRISTSHSHRSQHHQPIPFSSALNQSPENLTNHQSIHDYPTQTPARDPSLHRISTSHSHRSQHHHLDQPSGSQKIQDSNSQKRPSILSESLNDAHTTMQPVPSGPHSLFSSNSIKHQAHPDPHFSQNLSTSHPASLPPQNHPSDHLRLDSVSQSARQSQKEYADSCLQSDYGRDRLRESQEAYQLAKERYLKAIGAIKKNDPEHNNVYEDNQSESDLFKYPKPELSHSFKSNSLKSSSLPNRNNPELISTPKHFISAQNDNRSINTLPQQAQERTELHEERLRQIQEQTQEQAEMHEHKLKQISDMEALIAVREKEVEIRVKQLEEALEVERLKCQEYNAKAKQLEEALEAERLKCIEQIKIAQENADRAASESIQRAEQERQRQLEEIQKESEEKQRLVRQECEAERKRLAQTQIQIEEERQEERQKEAEARMLAETEKLRLENQAHLDQEAQANAQERERLAMRAEILERDRKKLPPQLDRRKAELIASFYPMSMWDFDPDPDFVPPPYLHPSYPPAPMSPHIVPEAVKKAACAQKEHLEKLRQQAEEETRPITSKPKTVQDQELAHHELEKRRAHQHATPDQSRHAQNQAHRRSGSLNRPQELPGSQPQSNDKARPTPQRENTSMAARERELRLQHLDRKNRERRKLEDALIAKTRAAFKDAEQQAMASGNLPTGSHNHRKREDLSEAQIRAAEAAAHLMAEQASSKTYGGKTSQTRDPNPSSHRRALDHATSSAAPVERAPQQPEAAFPVYPTGNVPGYTHEVVKPIESSVVLRVDHPSPIDYLKNDPRGHERRLQSDQLARQALIDAAQELGANAIIYLSHPSPVLVDQSRVNFSATGIAVTLKNPSAMSRAGLGHYGPHPPELDARSHPSHSEPEQPLTPHEVPTSASSIDSIPFGETGSDKQSNPEDCFSTQNPPEESFVYPVPKNQQVINTSPHGFESSSIRPHFNQNDSDYKSPDPSHRRRQHSPRVIHEENYYTNSRVPDRASKLPVPPKHMTPKVMVQSPSDKSSRNESKDDSDSPHQNHFGISSPTSVYSSSAKRSSDNVRSPHVAEVTRRNSVWSDVNPVFSPEKPPVNPFSPPAGTSDCRSSGGVTATWDELASPTDLGSASRVTNTDYVGANESGTSSRHQTSPVTPIRRPASRARALSRISESDRSAEKVTAQPSEVSHAENPLIMNSSIPSLDRFMAEIFGQNTPQQDEPLEHKGYKKSPSHSPIVKTHHAP